MSRDGNKTDRLNGWNSSTNSWTERILLAFMAFASFWLIAPQPAHAYLNMATGSLLMQMWAASWLALLFYGKSIWRGVSDFIKMHCVRKKPGE